MTKAVVIPNLSGIQSSDFPIIVGLIGTTITPWMQFYIQAATVEKGIKVENLWLSKIDVIIGCSFMFLVTLLSSSAVLPPFTPQASPYRLLKRPPWPWNRWRGSIHHYYLALDSLMPHSSRGATAPGNELLCL